MLHEGIRSKYNNIGSQGKVLSLGSIPVRRVEFI